MFPQLISFYQFSNGEVALFVDYRYKLWFSVMLEYTRNFPE